MHNQEELEMVKVQISAMVIINDELLHKNNELQMYLTLAQGLVDAKRTHNQGFIEANQELMNRYKDKELEAKDQELQSLQINLALEIAN